jgi:hypothetical protein
MHESECEYIDETCGPHEALVLEPRWGEPQAPTLKIKADLGPHKQTFNVRICKHCGCLFTADWRIENRCHFNPKKVATVKKV